MSETTWVKWWKSKDAWIIIIAGLLAMATSFCSAYFLQWPWNLIGVIILCIPAGIIMRKTLIKILINIITKNTNNKK